MAGLLRSVRHPGEGDPLLTVDGSVSNVIGLPMETLGQYLAMLAEPCTK